MPLIDQLPILTSRHPNNHAAPLVSHQHREFDNIFLKYQIIDHHRLDYTVIEMPLDIGEGRVHHMDDEKITFWSFEWFRLCSENGKAVILILVTGARQQMVTTKTIPWPPNKNYPMPIWMEKPSSAKAGLINVSGITLTDTFSCQD